MGIVIAEGLFETEEDAWNWVNENNCPLVDYEIVAVESTDNTPPWIE